MKKPPSMQHLADRIANVRDRRNRKTMQDRIMHLYEEVFECHEHVKNGSNLREIVFKDDNGVQKPDGFPIEVADVMIECLRIFDDINMDPDKMLALKVGYLEDRRRVRPKKQKKGKR